MQKASEWLMTFSSEAEVEDFLKLKNHNGETACTKVAITGGKGGVGKTSVSLKIAQNLHRLGHRVLLIDCDYNLSNTAIKLGLSINDNFWKLLAGEKQFKDCLVNEYGFHLLPACNGSLDLFEARLSFDEMIIDIVSNHEKEYDYILLDCPAGLSRESLVLSAYCDQRIIVVSPDKSSITDSYSLLKVLSKKFNIRENHLLVNMFETNRQFEKVVMTISETAESFLQIRTNVFGGVRKLDINTDSFDKFFLAEGQNGWHQGFTQMVEDFAEKFSKTRSQMVVPPRANLMRAVEQEVQ